MSHVAKDGEDDGGREEGCEGVHAANKDGITVAIMMELVVAAKGQKSSNTNAVRKENLSAAIYNEKAWKNQLCDSQIAYQSTLGTRIDDPIGVWTKTSVHFQPLQE